MYRAGCIDRRRAQTTGGAAYHGHFSFRAKRPGRSRGACLRRGSSGLRRSGFIRHGPCVIRGVLLRTFHLYRLLRPFALEDGRHPPRAIGKPFGLAGNFGLLQLRQSDDVLRCLLAHSLQNRAHVEPYGLRQFSAGLVRRGARRHHVHCGSHAHCQQLDQLTLLHRQQ